MQASSGIAKYANLIILVADREKATHIRIHPADTAAVIDLWRKDTGWKESELTDRAQPFHMHLMRQFAMMLSGEVPPPKTRLTGSFALALPERSVHVLGAIAHDHEVVAYFELVDADTYATARPPRAPEPS